MRNVIQSSGSGGLSSRISYFSEEELQRSEKGSDRVLRLEKNPDRQLIRNVEDSFGGDPGAIEQGCLPKWE